MTVEQLLSTISSAELTEWMAYRAINGPWGDDRADFRAGMITAAVINSSYYRPKKGHERSPLEFMPFRDAASSETVPAPTEKIDREAGAKAIKDLFVAVAGPLKTGQGK